MNEVILPPSPNWYFSSILACAHDGTISWGARNAIVVAKPNKESGSLNYSIIDRAHTEKVTTLAFSPEYKNNILRLVSGGDDNVIKIWNLRDLSVEQENVKLDKTYKVVAVDWSKHNVDLIAFVSENGFLVTWNIKFENSQIINLGKVTATCLSCCPHDSFIVSIGTKSGLVYVVDIRGSGTIKYKLRGHDLDIVSLSWCPVPVNVLQDDKSTKEYLLASGSKDRQIFIWKAGTDGRYQLQLPFPTAPLETSGHKSKVSSSAGNFTSIFWLKPTILLSSMPWGELVLWDLSGNMKKRTPELIHAKHSKSLFAIAALVDKSKESNENGQVENWRTANNIKSIWTVSQDRQIICCNLTNNETCFDYIITSQGGFVYCLDACPIDTTQIAFGVGDSMIRVWNLSEPNKNIFQPQMLWEKIKGKVRALAWHPEKENILAFATNEGRVGIFDTYSKKPPILYRQYHRHVVYTIGWGPAPDVNGFALYSCGDNELIYYNPEKINDVPTSVKKKDCTEFSWKSDNSLLAMGFSDGSISFYNRDLSQCGSTMHVLSKPIQVFKWHPISTLADSNISEMQNYLAVAVNSTTITIFDISINKLEDKTEKLTFKTVAVLDGHSEKVVCLAWSPHINGYLASGSYDRTVQVWKIHTSGDHEIIASYVSHLAPINCCMWSPLSHDLIITGSIDFSLRIWSISGQKTLMPSEVAKTSTRGKRTKKKKTKVEELNKNDTIIVNNTEQEKINLIVSTQNQKETDEGSIQNTGDSKIMKKKKMKKTTHFPGYSQLTLDNKLWCKSIQHLLDVQKSDKCIQQITNGCAKINIHEEISPNDSPEILNLFGSKDDLTKTLLHERKILEQNAQYNICTEIDLWSGNLKENLQRAQKNKHLNDFMVSLAPSISMKFWEELCEAYANQLVSEEIPHKAVSYFLIINKFEEAVSVLRTFKLYKEAYALLTLRLDSNDPLLIEVLNEWAYHAQKDGNFQSAIACYIKIGNLEKAANLLDRRNDLDSLILAIHVAETANNPVLTKSLADKAISKALLKNDIDAAKSIIKTYPFIKYREIEVVIFNELNEIHMNVDKNQIYKWLKGEATDLSLLDKISKQFNESPNEYSSLSNFQEVSDSESSIKLIQILVSRQIGLSILSNEKKQKIAHILKAADIIYQYEKSSIETKQLLLIKYLYSFDTRKFTDCNSIYNYNENKLGSSLRAYLCYALVSWYGPESHLTSDEKSELLDTLIPIFKTYVADLISKESVKYWTAVNEVKTLDGELSSTMGNLIKSSDEALKEFSTIEKLNLLKNTVAELQAEIMCTPNPLSSYAAMMELVSEIKIENIKIDLTNLVIETMEQSYLMSKNES